MDVFEELLPAQNASYDLGLKLRLSPEKVESIHANPRQRLRQVIERGRESDMERYCRCSEESRCQLTSTS